MSLIVIGFEMLNLEKPITKNSPKYKSTYPVWYSDFTLKTLGKVSGSLTALSPSFSKVESFSLSTAVL